MVVVEVGARRILELGNVTLDRLSWRCMLDGWVGVWLFSPLFFGSLINPGFFQMELDEDSVRGM